MKIVGWFLPLYFLMGCLPLSAQELSMPPIPPMRMLYHDQINASFELIAREHMKSARSADDSLVILNRDGLIRKKIDDYRAAIELDSSFSDNDRYKWLRSLRELLDGYRDLLAAKKIQSMLWPQLIDSYGSAMKATWAGQSYMPVFENLAPETSWLLLQNKALQTNPAREEAADWLLLQQVNRDPSAILPLLSKQPHCRYADSLIIQAAFLDQEKLYTYAAVPNA